PPRATTSPADYRQHPTVDRKPAPGAVGKHPIPATAPRPPSTGRGTRTGQQRTTMTFTTLHITLTATTVAVLTLAVGMWRLPRPAWRQALVIALLSGAAVFLWRLSANKPQLNDDGLRG